MKKVCLTYFLHCGFFIALHSSLVAQNALHFRAETDTVKIAGNTTLDTTVTIEAIVKFDKDQPKLSDASQPFLNLFVEDWVGKGSMGQVNFGVTTSGLMGFAAPNYLGSYMTQKDKSISKNEWHHAAYVIDADTERLYLDGGLIQSRPSQNLNIWESTTSSFLGYGWLGYLSSFRISKVARYTGAAYTKPGLKLTNDASTLLLYNFSSVSGNTINDESGNGRNGTLGGSTPRAVSPTTAPAVEPISPEPIVRICAPTNTPIRLSVGPSDITNVIAGTLPSGWQFDAASGQIFGRMTGTNPMSALLTGQRGTSPPSSVSVPVELLPQVSQSIAFTARASAKVGDIIPLLTTSSSKLPVSVTSSDPNILRVEGSNAAALSKGRVTLTATQDGNEKFAPATPIKRTVTVR